MNRVSLIGRVAKEIELKTYKENGCYVSFPLAVSHYDNIKKENITNFIEVIAWNKRAEFITQYIDKGDLISIEGVIKVSSYIDKNDNKRYSTKVEINQCDILNKVNINQRLAN